MAAVALFQFTFWCFLLDFNLIFVSVFILILILVLHSEGNDFQLVLQLQSPKLGTGKLVCNWAAAICAKRLQRYRTIYIYCLVQARSSEDMVIEVSILKSNSLKESAGCGGQSATKHRDRDVPWHCHCWQDLLAPVVLMAVPISVGGWFCAGFEEQANTNIGI